MVRVEGGAIIQHVQITFLLDNLVCDIRLLTRSDSARSLLPFLADEFEEGVFSLLLKDRPVRPETLYENVLRNRYPLLAGIGGVWFLLWLVGLHSPFSLIYLGE